MSWTNILIAVSEGSWLDIAVTIESDIETSLCDEENHLAEADSVLNQKKVNVSDSMTALLKVSSDPEASGRSFQHETPHSKEETVGKEIFEAVNCDKHI